MFIVLAFGALCTFALHQGLLEVADLRQRRLGQAASTIDLADEVALLSDLEVTPVRRLNLTSLLRRAVTRLWHARDRVSPDLSGFHLGEGRVVVRAA